MDYKKDLYGKLEFAKLINKNPRTIDTLVKKGIIKKGKKEGRNVYFTKKDLFNALKYYESINKTYSDAIFSNDIDFVKMLMKEYKLTDPIIYDESKELINSDNKFIRIFIDNNYLRKEEVDFLEKFAKMKEIEVVILKND